MNLERRAFQLQFQLRARGAEKMGISGHAAVFNQLSEDLGGGWREKIAPGAFHESIQRDDIRSLWNHNVDNLLGRNKSGTLRLEEDAIGLAIDNDFPDTTVARDVYTLIERGDISGMSFGFWPLREDYDFSGPVPVRILLEVKLFDVSPVTDPAYIQTDISVRSMLDKAIQEKIAALRPPNLEALIDLALREQRLKITARFLRGGLNG